VSAGQSIYLSPDFIPAIAKTSPEGSHPSGCTAAFIFFLDHKPSESLSRQIYKLSRLFLWQTTATLGVARIQISGRDPQGLSAVTDALPESPSVTVRRTMNLMHIGYDKTFESFL
jgi:hypothetical protein